MRITTLSSLSRVRLGLVCVMAFAVGMPVALISLAKLLLLLGALALLVHRCLRRPGQQVEFAELSSPTILLALGCMALSIAWSTATTDDALTAVAKHGKLILIPVILSLLRTQREAAIALAFFVAGQLLLLGSTWLIYLGVSVPWAAPRMMGRTYAVFSSYLDQSIMSAVLGAVCWHMRSFAPERVRPWLAPSVAALATVCVFFIFEGRTGQVVALALITLAVIWTLPKRFRIGAVVLPCLLLAILAACSSNMRKGLSEISRGVTSYSQSGDTSSTSSSIRLNLWHRSLQSIAQQPWHGSGAGSWTVEFVRQEQQNLSASVAPLHGNPHQEYLLWGVELGVPGIVLLCAVLLAIYRDSRRLPQAPRRALQSVLVALGLACLFNSSLYDALIGDFFCVALALLLAWAKPDPESHVQSLRSASTGHRA